MFIPVFSVSLIGLVVALRRQSPGVGIGPLALAGLVGAWLGYGLGWIGGGVTDIVLFFGFWPVLLGHVGALAIARLTVRNRLQALPRQA